MYKPITIVENDQDVWMEVEYKAVENEETEEPDEITTEDIEIISYYQALAGIYSNTLEDLPEPTCRETMLLRRLLNPDYTLPITYQFDHSRIEGYLLDLIFGTTEMLSNIPKSDKEKYLYVAIGGKVDEMPNPDACLLNYWMNEWVKTLNN